MSRSQQPITIKSLDVCPNDNVFIALAYFIDDNLDQPSVKVKTANNNVITLYACYICLPK